MTVQQYIDRLNTLLSPLNAHEREEILDQVKEHYAQGHATGRSDQDIAAALGAPEAFAAQYLPQGYYATGYTVRDGAYLRSEDFHSAAIHTIRVSSAVGKLFFLPSADDVIRVRLSGNVNQNQLDKIRWECSIVGDTLSVQFEAFRSIWPWIESGGFTRLELTVYIPLSFRGNLFAKASAGPMNLASFSLGDVDLTSSAGSIKADRLLCSSLVMQVSASSVHAQNVEASGLVRITSSAGSARVDELSARRTIIKASAGSVQVNDLRGGELDASSSAGSVKVTASRLSGNIDMTSSAGSVTLHVPETEAFQYNIHVTSGSAYCDFGGMQTGKNGNKQIIGQMGSGGCNISLRSSAGSAALRRK